MGRGVGKGCLGPEWEGSKACMRGRACQQEGGRDAGTPELESAGCPAHQARAGLGMTRPGHCQQCSPCPCAGCHSTHSQANQRRGPHGKEMRGTGHLSKAQFPPFCPGPDPALGPAPPALSLAMARCLQGSLFVPPQIPTSSSYAPPAWASVLASPGGQSGQA